MNDNTILRIKVPAHLYESVKEQLTLTEAKKAGHNLGAGMELVKEKKMKAPKDGIQKVEEVNNIEETDNKMEMKTRTLDELKAAKDKLEKKIQEMQGKDEANKMEEAEIGSFMDPNFIAGLATLLGVGGTLVTALVKDLKKAKSPEEKKAVFAKASDSIETAMGK